MTATAALSDKGKIASHDITTYSRHLPMHASLRSHSRRAGRQWRDRETSHRPRLSGCERRAVECGSLATVATAEQSAAHWHARQLAVFLRHRTAFHGSTVACRSHYEPSQVAEWCSSQHLIGQTVSLG